MRVVFSFGANDTTIEEGRLRVPPEETATNLDAVLVRAAALDLPAFVVGPSPVNDARQRRRVIHLARRMNDVSTGRGIPFVDVATSIDAHGVWRDESERGDGAHPGASGYAYLAELVADPWGVLASTPARPLSERVRRCLPAGFGAVPGGRWAIGARAAVASAELINPATMDIRGEAARAGAAVPSPAQSLLGSACC